MLPFLFMLFLGVTWLILSKNHGEEPQDFQEILQELGAIIHQKTATQTIGLVHGVPFELQDEELKLHFQECLADDMFFNVYAITQVFTTPDKLTLKDAYVFSHLYKNIRLHVSKCTDLLYFPLNTLEFLTQNKARFVGKTLHIRMSDDLLTNDHPPNLVELIHSFKAAPVQNAEVWLDQWNPRFRDFGCNLLMKEFVDDPYLLAVAQKAQFSSSVFKQAWALNLLQNQFSDTLLDRLQAMDVAALTLVKTLKNLDADHPFKKRAEVAVLKLLNECLTAPEDSQAKKDAWFLELAELAASYDDGLQLILRLLRQAQSAAQQRTLMIALEGQTKPEIEQVLIPFIKSNNLLLLLQANKVLAHCGGVQALSDLQAVKNKDYQLPEVKKQLAKTINAIKYRNSWHGSVRTP